MKKLYTFFQKANLNEAIIVKGNHQNFILYSLSPVQEKNSPVLNNGEPPLSRAYCVQSLVETTTVVLKKMSFGAHSHWAVHEGFFSVPNLREHMFEGHLRGPMTSTTFAKHLAVLPRTIQFIGLTYIKPKIYRSLRVLTT